MRGTAGRGSQLCHFPAHASWIEETSCSSLKLDRQHSRAEVLAGGCQVTFQRPVEVGDLLQLRCHIMHTDTRHDLGKVRHVLYQCSG